MQNFLLPKCTCLFEGVNGSINRLAIKNLYCIINYLIKTFFKKIKVINPSTIIKN